MDETRRPPVTAAAVCAAATVAALLVVPQAADAFEGPKRLVWLVLSAAGLLAWCFRAAAERGRTLRMAGGALLLWLAARSLLAAPCRATLGPLVAWLLPFTLGLAASARVWTDRARRALARTVALLGLVEAALMLLQRFGADPLFGGATAAIAYAPGRMVGSIGYQNQAAEFLGVALCYVPAAWRRGRGRLAFAVPLLLALALTANRGALLALAVVAGGAAAWRVWLSAPRVAAWWRLASAPLLAAAVAAAILVAPEGRSRLAELAHPARSVAVQSRAWMRGVAVAILFDHPLCGAGAGAYAREYVSRLGGLLPERKEHALLQSLVWAKEAHCDPLQFAAEFGLIGVGLLAAWAVALARTIRRGAGGDFARCAVAAAAFLSVSSLFSFSWQTALAAPLAGCLLGVAAAPSAREGSRTGKEPVAFLVAAVLFSVMPAVALFGANTPVVSPAVLVAQAISAEKDGRFADALAAWRDLCRSGLWHEQALRGASQALERLGRHADAAAAEAERFRLWPQSFSDAELFRLCALDMMAGNAEHAEWISRRFKQRCAAHDPSGTHWTAEWENLRGGALLALGRRDEARACFEEALRRKGDLASARRNLAGMANGRQVPRGE